MKRVVVTAPRGSGGATTHLRNVIPRLQRLHPDWRIEVHAAADVLNAAFGHAEAPWMAPIAHASYGARVAWEMIGLPKCIADSDTVIYSPFGPLLNVGAASRTVWASRNIIPLLPWATWEMAPVDHVRTLSLRYLVIANALLAKRTICVSQHARKRLLELAKVRPNAVRVVPHGADAAEPESKCDDPRAQALRAEPFLLNVGQPTPYRRTRELILAFTALARRRADIPRLVIVGEPRAVDRNYGEECRRLLEPWISKGRAAWLGALPHQDVLILTACATAIVYPSVHEDCPNAVLEALAAGRVLVCADIAATREIAEEAALFVAHPGADTLAAAMDKAVYDSVFRRDVESRARVRSALFTWEKAAESTARVLEDAFGH